MIPSKIRLICIYYASQVLFYENIYQKGVQMIRIKTVKNKIIIYFLIITIVPTIAITFFNYKNTNEIYENHMLENAFVDIYYIKRSIDEKISMAISFMDWFHRNQLFDNILTQDFNEDKIEYDQLDIYKQIKSQAINSPLDNYISSLIIVGDNQIEFRYGNDASMIDLEEIRNEDWFKAGINKNGTIHWPGITKNPAKIKSSEYVIPIARPIFHSILNKKIGWFLITFKGELFSDIYLNEEEIDIHKYFIIDQYGESISYQIEEEIVNKAVMNKDRNKYNENKGFSRSDQNGEEILYVYEELGRTDWTLVEVLPLAGLNEQKRVLTRATMIVFLSSFIFTSFLVIFLSFNLTNPLKKIISHVNRISTGVFEGNKEIEGQDEMGTLGRKINEMARNIKQLMAKLVEEEQEKRELELKALQNQINPHFLYNTLNSIKWMATVQQAEGIKNIVVALGRLLKSLSSDTIEKISLEEEIKLLEDYIFIQQIRYKGKIKFNIEIRDEEILKCKILKFTLQPIVENSIFHGIEAKKKAGKIELFIDTDQQCNDIIIKIKDDGVGITKEKLKEVIDTCTQKNKGQGLSSIGLSNVHNRIRLIYGNSYGLKIDSIPGEYTLVVIRIPYEI